MRRHPPVTTFRRKSNLLANLAETPQRPIAYGVAGMYRRALVPPYAMPADSDATARTRLVALLDALGSGSDSSTLSAVRGFTTRLLDDVRRDFLVLADSSRGATFHGCDDLTRLDVERHGATIARSCYVDFTGNDGPTLVPFWLTARGEVADVSQFSH